MTVHDPQWTEKDRALAMAWQREDRLRCPGCGMSRLESTARKNQGRFMVEPFYCHACAAMQTAQKQNRDSNGHSAGLYLTPKKRN